MRIRDAPFVVKHRVRGGLFSSRCKRPDDKPAGVREEKLDWTVEHVIGIASGALPLIKKWPRSDLEAECLGTDMHRAMKRCTRENSPIIAEQWKTASFRKAIVRSDVCRNTGRVRNVLETGRVPEFHFMPNSVWWIPSCQSLAGLPDLG